MGWNAADRDHDVMRVRRLLDRHVVPAVFRDVAPLEVAANHVRGEPIDPHEAMAATYEPFAVGQPWGPPWGTTWFRMRGTVPAAWAGCEVVARITVNHFQRTGFGAEGLVWIDGQPHQGISPNHDVVRLEGAARGDEQVELFVEAAANPQWHIADGIPGTGGVPAPDPEAPPCCRLQRAELAVRDRQVDELRIAMEHLVEVVVQLAPDDQRARRIGAALASACRRLDPRDPAGSASHARQALGDVLDTPAVPSAHHVTAVGHSHIDTAWLWPMRETVRKASRTFSTVLRLMDDHPDFRFVCSQPQQYVWIRDRFPALYERIREKVARGQWEPVGAMWVEADCNLPSGESLVRQLVHGKRFLLEEFGLEARELFLPDAFGYSPALPQLMKLAGVDHFLSTKMSWNQVNAFPHHDFWWEGLDGTRVLAHFPPANTYNGMATPDELDASARRSTERGSGHRSLYLYGWGDGGGGPTGEMIERLRLSRDLEGLPRVELGTVAGFFEDLAGRADDLPVWVGELYLELHRGTYTTQARVKRGNRQGEIALRNAEVWSSLLGAAATYPAEELDAAWKRLLLHQFHDVLPGSSIAWVYEDTHRVHADLLERMGELTDDVLEVAAHAVDTRGLTDPAVVFNALTHERRAVVDGADGPISVVVPAMGYTAVDRASPVVPPGTVESGPDWMSNEHLRVTWDEQGLLTRITDLQAGREVLADGAAGNVLHLHRDEPNEHDAWDIDRAYLDDREELTAADEVVLVESTPQRARLRVTRSFGSSRIEQVIELTTGSRRLDVHTSIDWQESERVLKAAFPVAVHSSVATYEVQFGHVQRSTHDNTSWDRARFEAWGHRWADLSETGYGVALLNDGKYGYDVRGNVLRLTLLRAPSAPDPDADRGRHTFTYALYPHPHGPLEGGVVEAAGELNDAVRVISTEPQDGPLPASASLIDVDRPGLVVDALKRADDGSGALIVRLSDGWGQRGVARLTLAAPIVSAERVDLLERHLDEASVDDGGLTFSIRPFEVVTFKLHLRSGADITSWLAAAPASTSSTGR